MHADHTNSAILLLLTGSNTVSSSMSVIFPYLPQSLTSIDVQHETRDILWENLRNRQSNNEWTSRHATVFAMRSSIYVPFDPTQCFPSTPWYTHLQIPP